MYRIFIRAEGEKDLYNRFDPDRIILSDDVKSYIMERMSERTPGDDNQIVIRTKEKVDENNVRAAFGYWLGEEKKSMKAEWRKNFFAQLWMFLVGVAFITASLVLQSRVSVVWFTVLSTIGAFSMWQAASIWIIDNPKLRLRRRFFRVLREKTELVFEQE